MCSSDLNDSRFHKVFKKWCKPDETNEDAGAYAKVLKELDQVAAQTKDGIVGLLANGVWLLKYPSKL